MKCSKCDGCGQVADTKDEEPWSVWLDLPLRSSLAVLYGLVRPKRCPECGGIGVLDVQAIAFAIENDCDQDD